MKRPLGAQASTETTVPHPGLFLLFSPFARGQPQIFVFVVPSKGASDDFFYKLTPPFCSHLVWNAPWSESALDDSEKVRQAGNRATATPAHLRSELRCHIFLVETCLQDVQCF